MVSIEAIAIGPPIVAGDVAGNKDILLETE
jgi:hypothetical protein